MTSCWNHWNGKGKGAKAPHKVMERTETTIFKNLIHNHAFMTKAFPFLKDEYFSQPDDKAVFGHIASYINNYGSSPTVEALALSLNADTGMTETAYSGALEIAEQIRDYDSNTSTDWALDSAEKFCKDRAIYNAIARGIKIIDGQDKDYRPEALPSLLSEALAVCFDTDVGHDFFANAHDRYSYYHSELTRIPFDLEELNRITDGGIPKKTLTCLLAGCVHPETKVKIRVRKGGA